MAILADLKKTVNEQSRPIRNIITSLLVVSFDALITTEKIFECPSKNNASYGWVFIFVPALIFLVLAVMLSEEFISVIQGCCYNVDRAEGFLSARWGCKNTKVASVIYNGIAASSLWLFWAFLQGRYYVCAVAGNKQDKLDKVKPDTNKFKEIEDLFVQTKTESQIIGFVIIALVVVIPATIQSIYRCCCKHAVSSIPGPKDYLKVEADCATEAFKTKFEALAKAEGEKKAEQLFDQERARRGDKSPTEMLKDVYNELKMQDGYSSAFSTTFDKAAATVDKAAFDAKLSAEAKNKIDQMTQDWMSREGDKISPFYLVENVHTAMVEQYPRSMTGDRSQPYVNLTLPNPNSQDRVIEMQHQGLQ
ncbi:hypothetical protein QZH41_002748 [Actinostola sp. cb2023]|nr:hypothetical protein QZH41_002748 [Actinostola sp. cb2023]